MTRVSLQQWQQAKEIFTEALTLSGSEQKEFLDRACGKDQTLRNEVESLLNSYQHAASFMEVPAVESAAESPWPAAAHAPGVPVEIALRPVAHSLRE